MLVLGILYPKIGRRAAIGFTAGILATIVYDVVRLVLVIALGLPDPIPHIGVMWGGTGLIDQWWVGYLWRFFGSLLLPHSSSTFVYTELHSIGEWYPRALGLRPCDRMDF